METVWNGSMDTAWIKSQQLPAPPLPPRRDHRTGAAKLCARILRFGPHTVREMAAITGMSIDATHHAVRVLRNSGRVERDGPPGSRTIDGGGKWRLIRRGKAKA